MPRHLCASRVPSAIRPSGAWQAWDERVELFQAAVAMCEGHGHGSGVVWTVRFDDGLEATVPLTRLRERWNVPVRLLCRWGNYHPARILESLAGLLRLDFGGGHVQWALPEQTLQQEPPSAEELVPGCFVAARLCCAFAHHVNVGPCHLSATPHLNFPSLPAVFSLI